MTRLRVLHSVGERLAVTHDRVREVAYSRILAPRRKVLHRRAAEALATLNEGDVEPYHLALALHYAEGEVWEQAVVPFRRPAAQTFERSSKREAVACFQRAPAVLANLPQNPSALGEAFEIHVECRLALSHLSEVHRMLDHLREAEALAERLNDDLRHSSESPGVYSPDPTH
jgi:hypothetical protein